MTAEEQAAIIGFLKEPGAAGAGAGRARTLARTALKFAGVLLLAAGVVAGYADGDEFDEVGCSVALLPGEGSHAANAGQPREREGGKLPRSDGGSAGGCGGGGGPGGRPEWEVRAAPRESLPTRLLLMLAQSTPYKLAAVERFLAGEPLPDTERRVRSARPEPAPGDKPSSVGADAGSAYVFAWTGRDWKVVFDAGRPFYLPDTQGARYVDYLLHHPNMPISAFDLEVAVQPEKGEARSRNSDRHEAAQEGRPGGEGVRRASADPPEHWVGVHVQPAGGGNLGMIQKAKG